MTVLYMRLPVQFSHMEFSCYLVWKHPKITNGSHVWGCWTFFSENQPNVLKFGFFCQNMMLVRLKDSNKYYGAFGKRCLKVYKLKDLFFWPLFVTCLWAIWVFFSISKSLRGTVWRKIRFGLKLFFRTVSPSFFLMAKKP